MKKQIYIFFLLSMYNVHVGYGMHVAARALQRTVPAASKFSTFQTNLQQKQLIQDQIRKTLYLKCTLGVALFATAVGCGYACVKNRAPVVVSNNSGMNSAPTTMRPTITPVQYSYKDFYGMAKLVGLCGSVVGLCKSCGSLWHDFTHFWSIKEDIRTGLAQQEAMQETLSHVQELLAQRDATDGERWEENQQALKMLHDQQENIVQNQNAQEFHALSRHLELKQEFEMQKKLLEEMRTEQQELSEKNSQENSVRFKALEEKINKLLDSMHMILTQLFEGQQPGNTAPLK